MKLSGVGELLSNQLTIDGQLVLDFADSLLGIPEDRLVDLELALGES